MIEWEATLREVVLSVAAALPSSVPVPIAVPPSKNVTVPVGAPPADIVTATVNVTDCPPTAGFSEEASVVVVVRGVITNGFAAELLKAKFESPEYWAIIECEPTASEEMLSVACPAPNVLVPSKIPLSRKLTLPVGVPVGVVETVAVIVTTWPNMPGFGDGLTVVTVAAP